MRLHGERHYAERIGWLRAAVLGANDGIVSTASLVVGVATAGALRTDVLLAGVAGLVAGAMSMAAGEYVSVSSQADTEQADLQRERRELEGDYESERRELAEIYRGRGLQPALAEQVAEQLMAHDALAAHARDELGLSEVHTARPVQASGSVEPLDLRRTVGDEGLGYRDQVFSGGDADDHATGEMPRELRPVETAGLRVEQRTNGNFRGRHPSSDSGVNGSGR